MADQAIDYEALAKQNGGISSLLSAPPAAPGGAIDYEALAKANGGISSGAPKPANWLDEVKEGASHFWDQLPVNPKNVIAAGEAMHHPLDAINNYGAQTDAIRQKAEDAFKAGNYAEGVRHSLGYVLNGLPGVGATLDKAGDETGGGHVGAGVGDTLGLAANLLGPAAAGKVIPKVGGAVSRGAEGAAEGLYKTALKPRTDTPAADVRAMAQTGLQNGLPISEAGAAKLAKLVQEHQAVIDPALADAGRRGVRVDPNAVATRLQDTRAQFETQVNPSKDLKAIRDSENDFLNTQGRMSGTPAGAPQPTGVLDASGKPIMGPGTPAVPATPAKPMTPAYAQALKQGTYRKIKAEYGDMSSAEIESQKALARGVKEELGAQIPEINEPLGAQGKLLDLDSVLTHSVNKAANTSLVGPVVGAAGAMGGFAVHGLEGGAMGAGLGIMAKVLADPALRSRLAITIYKASQLNPAKYGAPSMAAATARVAGYGAALQKAMLPAPADLAKHYASTPGAIGTPEEHQAAAEMAIKGPNATQ